MQVSAIQTSRGNSYVQNYEQKSSVDINPINRSKDKTSPKISFSAYKYDSGEYSNWFHLLVLTNIKEVDIVKHIAQFKYEVQPEYGNVPILSKIWINTAAKIRENDYRKLLRDIFVEPRSKFELLTETKYDLPEGKYSSLEDYQHRNPEPYVKNTNEEEEARLNWRAFDQNS